MKKFLILGLILAVAGGAFAQTFSGSVGTGFGIIFPDKSQTNNNALFTMQRDVFGGNSLEANLNVTATNADGTAEVYFGLRATNGNDLQFRMENGNVRFNFLDKTLQLIIGRGGPGGFSTGAPRGQSLDVAEGGTGHVSVVYNVTPELRFGLTIRPGFHTTGNFTASQENRLRRLPIALGVRYAIPDVGSLHLNFSTSETTSDNRIFNIAIGANLGALVSGTNLTRLAFSFAALDLTKNRTGANANRMDLQFSEGVTFAFDDLTVLVDLRQEVRLPTGLNMQMNLHFRVNASYKVNDIITPGLDVGFVLGQGITANYRRPTDALSAEAGGRIQDAMGVALNPYVNFAIGPSITMQAGYTFARTLKGNSLMTNAVYLNASMSF